MIQELTPLAYAKEVLEKMKPGIFLNTSAGGIDNTMIIGWGGISVIWGKPIMMVLVRESRATYDLLEASMEFSISVPLSTNMMDAIKICGTKSLREMDKFLACNLTKVPGRKIKTPIIKECDLHYECKVIYKQKLDQTAFSSFVVDQYYQPGNDSVHTLYFGEIIDTYRYYKGA